MKDLIRKELLSAVLGKEVQRVDSNLSYFEEYSSAMLGVKINNYVQYWNIHELAHRSKEWAYEKDFYIYSVFSFAGEGLCYVTKDEDVQKRLTTISADSEPEAIFKACQWILENK